MNPPTVYIETKPLLNMLLAAVDTFKMECFGYICGKKPTRKNNMYVIDNVNVIQSTTKRANTEVKISKSCYKRLCKISSKYPSLYPEIGYFHSHPEWGSAPGSHEMSDGDVEEMANSNSEIGIIIKISSRKRERLDWVSKIDGGIRGSYGDYVVDINVYRLIKRENQNIPESLQIIAPTVIKKLNRANNKKSR